MAKKYRVHLTVEEQEELKGLVSKGRTAAYRQTHARILLLLRSKPDPVLLGWHTHPPNITLTFNLFSQHYNPLSINSKQSHY